MTIARRIPPFVLRVDDAFAFSGGVTVLVGRLESGAPSMLAPCNAELVVEGQSRGEIWLESERMQGPRSAGRRAVETMAHLEVAELRDRDCVLIHR